MKKVRLLAVTDDQLQALWEAVCGELWHHEHYDDQAGSRRYTALQRHLEQAIENAEYVKQAS